MFRIKKKRPSENNLCSRKRPNQSFSIPEKVADKKAKNVVQNNVETGYLKVNEDWTTCSSIEEMRDRGASQKEYEFCGTGDFLTEFETDSDASQKEYEFCTTDDSLTEIERNSDVHSYEGQFEPRAASSPKPRNILMSEASTSAPKFWDFLADEPDDIQPELFEEDEIINIGDPFSKSKEIARKNLSEKNKLKFQIYEDPPAEEPVQKDESNTESRHPPKNPLQKENHKKNKKSEKACEPKDSIHNESSRRVFKTLGYHTIKNKQICSIVSLKNRFKFP